MIMENNIWTLILLDIGLYAAILSVVTFMWRDSSRKKAAHASVHPK